MSRLGSVTSKALAKSTNMAIEKRFSLMLLSHCSTIDVNAVWQEWLGLNLDCVEKDHALLGSHECVFLRVLRLDDNL